MNFDVHRTKLGRRGGFWQKCCDFCGEPLATKDIQFRASGYVTRANLKLLDRIPIVVTAEKVSQMRGDDVCCGYHEACFDFMNKAAE